MLGTLTAFLTLFLIGLALNCDIAPWCRFARKNYFYPDMPKNFQISQYDEPLCTNGYLDVEYETEEGMQTVRVEIERVHMEEDTGKSLHIGGADGRIHGATHSLLDYNRAGVPLVEIVSEPDMRSSDEAFAYLTEMKQLMQFAMVSTCDMEKGHLRCDANVSVRLHGAPQFGTKVEVKNVNSFRNLKIAIDFEVQRQIAIIENGGTIHQESRSFNADTSETVSMRSKEMAHDYRYFPEPDLLPLQISTGWLDRVKGEMPELPVALRKRFIEEYGLREYDAQVLTLTGDIATYYQRAAKASDDPKLTANWVMGDLSAALKAEGKDISDSPVTPENLGLLVTEITKGALSGKLAKEIFPKMFATGDSALAIMDREGLRQISDTSAIEKIIDDVLVANPKQVEQYKGGKTTVIGFLVGQVMKASRGQAAPGAVNDLLKAKLDN